jgi:hypothetical protein
MGPLSCILFLTKTRAATFFKALFFHPLQYERMSEASSLLWSAA